MAHHQWGADQNRWTEICLLSGMLLLVKTKLPARPEEGSDCRAAVSDQQVQVSFSPRKEIHNLRDEMPLTGLTGRGYYGGKKHKMLPIPGISKLYPSLNISLLNRISLLECSQGEKLKIFTHW